MTDRTVKILENGRQVLRGINSNGRDLLIYQDKDETLKYTLDFTGWLNGDTISSVALETHGPTVSSANTTTTVTLTISNVGGISDHTTVRITTAAGLIKDTKLLVRERDQALHRDYV